MEQEQDYLSVAAFAEALGVHKFTIYEWLKNGHPIHGPLRRRHRVAAAEIPASEVSRLMAEVPVVE